MRDPQLDDDRLQAHCHCVDGRRGCLHGCRHVDRLLAASHPAACESGYGFRRSGQCHHCCRQVSCQHNWCVRRLADHHRDRHGPVVVSCPQRGVVMLQRLHGSLLEGQASWREHQSDAQCLSYSHAHRQQRSSSQRLHGQRARYGQYGGHTVQARWAVRN